MPDLLEVSFLLLSGIAQIAPYGAFVTHTPYRIFQIQFDLAVSRRTAYPPKIPNLGR